MKEPGINSIKKTHKKVLRKVILVSVCQTIAAVAIYSQRLPTITVSEIEAVRPVPITHMAKEADREVVFRLTNTTGKPIIVYGSEVEAELQPIRYFLSFDKTLKMWKYPNPKNAATLWKDVSSTYKKSRRLKAGDSISFKRLLSSQTDCGASYKVTVQVRIGAEKKSREVRSAEFTLGPCLRETSLRVPPNTPADRLALPLDVSYFPSER